jgi:hypothetical protein
VLHTFVGETDHVSGSTVYLVIIDEARRASLADGERSGEAGDREEPR